MLARAGEILSATALDRFWAGLAPITPWNGGPKRLSIARMVLGGDFAVPIFFGQPGAPRRRFTSGVIELGVKEEGIMATFDFTLGSYSETHPIAELSPPQLGRGVVWGFGFVLRGSIFDVGFGHVYAGGRVATAHFEHKAEREGTSSDLEGTRLVTGWRVHERAQMLTLSALPGIEIPIHRLTSLLIEGSVGVRGTKIWRSAEGDVTPALAATYAQLERSPMPGWTYELGARIVFECRFEMSLHTSTSNDSPTGGGTYTPCNPRPPPSPTRAIPR